MASPSTASRPRLRSIPVGDTDRFRPDARRPVRLRSRAIAADSHFEPHCHPWAQLAYCASGIVQVTASTRTLDSQGDEMTYIVPPSRAVWIAPGARHAIHVLQAAELRTLYIDASAAPPGWQGCRVIVVSALLRELVGALDEAPAQSLAPAREEKIAGLLIDEISRADTMGLGVPLPHAQTGDKRLRALCEAVLRSPAERATLAGWAGDVGASERTLARLFRTELGMSYQRWRQQAVLAHALPLLAQGMAVSHVAAASGYASDSAFTAMFKAALGQPPRAFHRRQGL